MNYAIFFPVCKHVIAHGSKMAHQVGTLFFTLPLLCFFTSKSLNDVF